MDFEVAPSAVNDATVTVPGDKSVSHRALMLGGIAEGTTQISGFLAGEDCLRTLAAMSALGVQIECGNANNVTVHGVGLHGLQTPKGAIDLGNSGTAMRLMAGLLSGQPFTTSLTGDESLTGRPMQRVITPLADMGATIDSHAGKPPLIISGRRPLQAIEYSLPVASAQVKSAVLLAGLYAAGETTVIEPTTTRDHTERMIGALGGAVDTKGSRISIRGGQALQGGTVQVPADLSSAAFVILAALLAENAEIRIESVGVNPTRTGVIDILQSMGGDIALENPRLYGQEPVADIRVRSSVLQGSAVDPALVSLAIDEFPVLFVAAAAASGRTTFTGIGELRVKESDRIAAMAAGLQAMGVSVDEFADGAIVHGGAFDSAVVDSHGDHRIAMSLAIAGTIANGPVRVRNVAAVDTSFPGFRECLAALGLQIDAAASTSVS